MQVPLSWLKEFVDIDQPAEWVAEHLTVAGLEVGHIRYVGVPQQSIEGIRQPKSHHLVWERDKILLAAIREVKQHPNADRLVLAMVDYGTGELEQCVTGAPNLRPYLGQGELNPPLWTAFALEGAVVYDGHSEELKLMTLKGKDLRGIFNKSMVCSERELGISEEHEGVILMEDRAGLVAGTPLQDVLGDVVFDIELTPNLGHCFSVLGVARELAALMNKPLRNALDANVAVVQEGDNIEGQAKIEIRNAELNPRFTAMLLKGTSVQASPYWVQYRLKLSGQRPINNIVDVTNYVTFEMGQPLHAFDYDKLVARAGGNAPTIITRTPEAGETLETLDGVKRALGANQILVCDTAGVLSLGGIIGGADTEIGDTTTNVLLEAASWHFINIRKTSQAQKVFTEAGTRFSRNIHPSRAMIGCRRGVELMRQWGGGVVAKGALDTYPQPPTPVQVDLPIAEVKRLLGVELSIQTVAEMLTRLAFDVTIMGATLRVVVPDYRTDISEGVVGIADLVEEVARVMGYDNIPDTMLNDQTPPQHTNVRNDFEERVRDICVSLGLTENISYRMVSPEAEAMLTPAGTPSSLPQADYVRLANPISHDKTVMRHTLLASLLQNAVLNARFTPRQQVFEVGNVYLLQAGQTLPDEPLRLGVLMFGARHEGAWMPDTNTGDLVDFYDMKGVIEGILHGLHLQDAQYTLGGHSSLHPARSATLHMNGQAVGAFGELHPQVAGAFRLTYAPVLVAELDLEALLALAPKRHGVKSLPITPAVLEDIALVVEDSLPAAQVEAVIRKAGGALLRDVRLFDVYKGANLPPNTKSLAYALTYQTDEKTLTDKDVAKVRGRIISMAERELNAKLRS